MLSSLLRSKRKLRTEHSPFSSACEDQRSDYSHCEESTVGSQSLSGESLEGDYSENTPLLPIFSATQLGKKPIFRLSIHEGFEANVRLRRRTDSIPVYNLAHSIRLDIVSRVNTTLAWDQLRSPQVSSFLVKPILSSLIRGPGFFLKGTLYSLLANCLQFRKEARENPGNASVLKTRALLAELLAMKLLREFSSRELVRISEVFSVCRTDSQLID